ncbi:MAG: DUF1398 domain-containing protein [Alphaproteobacteria bacterium]|nr:DUF1398 domain-containing protein [Alphaproteobacteria bacterium]
MNAQLVETARQCLGAAYDGTASFPQIVGNLMAAGFEGYTVDYRRNTTAYFTPGGESVVLDNPVPDAPVAASFDREAVAEQIRWAQANPPGYSYVAFCKNVKALGCAGYIVSFLGRRVLYYGRTAETHVEHFPQ